MRYLTVLPSDDKLYDDLSDLIATKLWSAANDVLANIPFIIAKDHSRFKLTINSLLLKEPILSSAQRTNLFHYDVEQTPLLHRKLVSDVSLHSDEWLVPIYQIDEFFCFKPIHFWSNFNQVDYFSVAFLDDYQALYQQVKREVVRVFMRYESHYSDEMICHVADALMMSNLSKYVDIKNRSFDMYILEKNTLFQLLDHTFDFLDTSLTCSESLFKVSLETYIESLLYTIDPGLLSDWLAGIFFAEDKRIHRILSDSYIYKDDRLVIRVSDTNELIVYFRIPRKVIDAQNVGLCSYNDHSFSISDNRFLLVDSNEAFKRLEERFTHYHLSIPCSEFEIYRVLKNFR